MKDRVRKIAFRADDELMRRAKEAAAREALTVSAVARRALKHSLDLETAREHGEESRA